MKYLNVDMDLGQIKRVYCDKVLVPVVPNIMTENEIAVSLKMWDWWITTHNFSQKDLISAFNQGYSPSYTCMQVLLTFSRRINFNLEVPIVTKASFFFIVC